MPDTETQNEKVFHVHRVIGRYEIQGTVTCIPAPPPGVLMMLAELAVEGYVQDLFSERMLEDLQKYN